MRYNHVTGGQRSAFELEALAWVTFRSVMWDISLKYNVLSAFFSLKTEITHKSNFDKDSGGIFINL